MCYLMICLYWQRWTKPPRYVNELKPDLRIQMKTVKERIPLEALWLLRSDSGLELRTPDFKYVKKINNTLVS